MPNPHANAALLYIKQCDADACAITQATLAVAYELRTQNLLRTAEIFATPHEDDDHDDLFLTTGTIMRERLS